MFFRKQNRIKELNEERARRTLVALQLLTLAEGCTKHPSYRAVRKPTAACTRCEELYAIRQMLNGSLEAAIIGYIPRTGKRGKSKPKTTENV